MIQPVDFRLFDGLYCKQFARSTADALADSTVVTRSKDKIRYAIIFSDVRVTTGDGRVMAAVRCRRSGSSVVLLVKGDLLRNVEIGMAGGVDDGLERDAAAALGVAGRSAHGLLLFVCLSIDDSIWN
jgi:hypothetical protein